MRSDINVTPMIDVLLVLLITFILLSQRYAIFANLAHEGGGGSSRNTIVLELPDEGGYRINTQPVDSSDLAAKLREIMAPRPDKVLYIRAGSQRFYGETIRAMDIAKGAGVEVLALAP